MTSATSIRALYEEVLDSFVSKVKRDRYIIAAVLGGSLSHDEVWEKSDIDLLLISEEKRPAREYCLVENGINIHASLMPRSKFKELLEGQLQSSFFHSYFSKSRLLFSHDETIAEYYHDADRVGARDREWQLLRAGAGVLGALAKAEKWYHVKRDLRYSFLWILYCVENLARIEVLQSGTVTGREVIHQALKINPDFFGAIYTGLIDGPKDEAAVGGALGRINAYLDERIGVLYGPILDYLSEAGGPRTATELDEYFRKKVQAGSLALAYEWLADKGVIEKVSSPLRLTEKSRVTVDEAAYYYDGEE